MKHMIALSLMSATFFATHAQAMLPNTQPTDLMAKNILPLNQAPPPFVSTQTAQAQTQLGYYNQATLSANQIASDLLSQGDNQAVSTLISASMVNADGTLAPVSTGIQIASGTVLEYQAYITNQSTDRIRSITVNLSIPQGMSFLGQVEPVINKASIDGINFSAAPLRANINGSIQNIPVNAYKAIQWQVEDIGIGGTAVLRYRVQVN